MSVAADRVEAPETDLPWVYGAAVVAAADDASAQAATLAAFARPAGRGAGPQRRRTLVARAVLEACRGAPCAALAPLPPREREVIALARYARLNVHEIALVTGLDGAAARRALTTGLRLLAADATTA